MDIGGIESAFSRQRCLHCDTRAPVWGIGREGEKITVTSLMVANYGSSNRICQATSGACGTGYIGIFDDVAKALDFDEKAVQQVVSNIEELRKALPVQVQKCVAFFPQVDRSVGGYEGLMAAQQCLPNNEVRDKFAANYIVLGTIWEALSPDPCLSPYEKDYRWLTAVYESVKPVSGNGRLLWHALGPRRWS